MIKTNIETYLEFTLQDSDDFHVDNTLCNSLRRIMISEVKTYSIEIVSISKNNTILIDDILSHRLGLVPIKVLCPELFDSQKHVISLDVSWDKTKTDAFEIQNVYSDALVYDKSMFYIDPNILIIRLLKNHNISLEAIVMEGTGYEHAKWSPVCATTFVENDKTLNSSTKSYTFKIEAVGQKKPAEIFVEAIEILQNKLLNAGLVKN